MAVGDKAIVAADSNRVERIDLVIPDQVFDIQNENEGLLRVQGIRDFQKELVYWCYPDGQTEAAPGTPTTFPNKVLVYNYRNSSWAIFRDNVTAFGTFQSENDITWDSQSIYWDSEVVTWDDVANQARFPLIVSGNQQGFVHYYQIDGEGGTPLVNANEQPSLTVEAIALVSGVLTITSPNHNLETGEIIYLSDLLFVDNFSFLPVATSLNGLIYRVTIVDENTFTLSSWNFVNDEYVTNFSFTPNLSAATYIGGGYITLFPQPKIQTIDFNPFQTKGRQTKLSYIDFLMDVPGDPLTGNITGASQSNPCVITSIDHGLITGQKILISGVHGMTQLNISIVYQVTVIDANSFSIGVNSTNFATYTGSGVWTLALAGAAVVLFFNSSPAIYGNLLVGNTQFSTNGLPPFYGPGSDYIWSRFYATTAGQYFSILLTYDDILMNTLTTHQQSLVLNAMNIWVRDGGKIMF